MTKEELNKNTKEELVELVLTFKKENESLQEEIEDIKTRNKGKIDRFVKFGNEKLRILQPSTKILVDGKVRKVTADDMEKDPKLVKAILQIEGQKVIETPKKK